MWQVLEVVEDRDVAVMSTLHPPVKHAKPPFEEGKGSPILLYPPCIGLRGEHVDALYTSGSLQLAQDEFQVHEALANHASLLWGQPSFGTNHSNAP
jgi:hypothetical protein